MTNSKREGFGKVVLLVVFAMIALQFVLKRLPSNERLRTPGAGRGDISLQSDCLPSQIGNWTKHTFEPTEEVENLPKAQHWWTHSWVFVNQSLSALVAFDQAAFTEWHELTICYRLNGWTLQKRTIVPSTDGWSFVIALFERNETEKAVLAFSFFDEQGHAVEAAAVDLSDLTNLLPIKRDEDLSVLERYGKRFGLQHPKVEEETASIDAMAVRRHLQCQVFVPVHKTIDEEMLGSISELHKVSRKNFKEAWVSQSASEFYSKNRP